MARKTNAFIENNFSLGLKTEFTGLNFPENACTETDNCIFERTGRVERRKGLEYEDGFVNTEFNRSGTALTSYHWKNAGEDGATSFVVGQVGDVLHFYDASSSAKVDSLSAHLVLNTINLSSFISEGNISSPSGLEAQFSSGYGFLFVFHPFCNPFYVQWNGTSMVAKKIDIKIRDFKGLPEVPPLADDERIGSLSTSHAYNLTNQGWTSAYRLFSQSENSFSGGLHQFVVDQPASSFPNIKPGRIVRMLYTPDFRGFMVGVVVSFIGQDLFVNVTQVVSPLPPEIPASVNSWFISDDPDNIRQGWAQAFANFPSNSDIWWQYKNADNVFDPANTAASVSSVLGLAPKGHYVISAFLQNRSEVSNVPAIGATNFTFLRPSTGAFHAGRVFYAGLNDKSYSNTIYFSQVIEDQNAEQFGKCYQVNDPTSETLFDVLPSDGGTLQITGADTIYKLFATQTFLVVFASNGVWVISGSTGIGFSATDFTVQKLDNTPTVSASSFIDVKGAPYWWNVNGVYTVQFSLEKGGIQVVPVSTNNIDTFFDTIPAASKKFARGAYNRTTYIIQWLYRSTENVDVTGAYNFDRILNFNTVTGAFYDWSIGSISGIFPHAIVIPDTEGNPNAPYTDIPISPVFKYWVSRVIGATTFFSFAEERDEQFADWRSIDAVGVDYNSFFTTGYKIHSQGLTKIQVPYLMLFMDTLEPVSYDIQAIWDYARTGDSGRFSQKEHVDFLAGPYSIRRKKHKIRGQGYSLQFRISSHARKPFSLIGWSGMENINEAP